MSQENYGRKIFPLLEGVSEASAPHGPRRITTTMPEGACPSAGTQAHQVLWILCYHSIVGQAVSNYDFLKRFIPRYSARIHELRKEFGWRIVKERGDRKGEWIYRLDEGQARELWPKIKEAGE